LSSRKGKGKEIGSLINRIVTGTVYAQDRGTGTGGRCIGQKGQLGCRKGFRVERAFELGCDTDKECKQQQQ